jgi:Tfp pilus assembly protein PilF
MAPQAPLDPAESLLATAVAKLAAGDIHAALRAASDACHAAPGRPEPHYAYGEAWAAIGEPARAEEAFAAALQRAPHWADAWVNYGVARYRRGAIGEAKMAMRQALLRDPRHKAAAANLGAFLRLTGEAEAAEALLRGAIEADPGNAAAKLNLAADLLQEERGAEALALLDGDAPGDAAAARHWRLQRALAFLQLGRTAEARAELAAFAALGPAPPALAPLWHWRHVLLALGEGDAAAAGAAAAAMEAALDAMGPHAVHEHRVMARYDLAKFRSGRGETARAFAHWKAAHEMLAAVQPFSRADHLATIEANIAFFDRARLSAGPRARNRDPAPVFIVGMPRSGTTLCERILAAHAQVHGAGERHALGDAFAALGGEGGAAAARRVAALDESALDAAAARYLEELHALAPDKARVVDKMPGNSMNLGLAGLMLPGARIIHCRRDPRDIGLSIFTFRFHGVHAYAHDLADLGWTIRQHERLMSHWSKILPVLAVDLIDWVDDFEGTLARVLAHIGLPPDPNCARFHEIEARVRTVSRAQVKEPVNAKGLGRWRAYADELAPLIAELGRGRPDAV